MNAEKVDLVVIGAGAGGLSVAAGAAQLGLKVALFERGEMGGDCLNYGCVPSKALIAAAAHAQAMRGASVFGIANASPQMDWAGVKAHVKGVIAAIAPIDSQERFEGLGVRVVREHARFTGADTIASESAAFRFRRAVIATGGRAFIPPIPGVEEAHYFTNETIFDAPALPKRLIILGAGPIGMELGQAFARLGTQIVILEAQRALARMDQECAALAVARLRAEGVDLREGAEATAVEKTETGVRVLAETDGIIGTVEGSDLLIALGRRAMINDMGLDAAGVAFTDKGVTTDASLRTTNRRIWAVGDVAGREQLTHAAGWHASVFVRNALFKARASADAFMPHVAYCDPEIAQIGLTEAQAREKLGDKVKTARWSFAENDRAQTERETEGFAKLVIGPGGKLLGASIAGRGAGEAIQLAALAMSNKLTVRALTNYISPYPTRSEIIKRAAGAYYTPLLFSPRTRALVGLLQSIP